MPRPARVKGLALLDIDPIKERASKATPGPWAVGPKREQSDFLLAAVGPHNVEGLHSTCGPGAVDDEDDARFIAHSRQDVDDLLTDVELLRSIVSDVANADTGSFTGARWICGLCKEEEDITEKNKLLRHKSECPWRRASEYLNGETRS